MLRQRVLLSDAGMHHELFQKPIVQQPLLQMPVVHAMFVATKPESTFMKKFFLPCCASAHWVAPRS
jgi:hypothetical protein